MVADVVATGSSESSPEEPHLAEVCDLEAVALLEMPSCKRDTDRLSEAPCGPWNPHT